MIAVAAFTVGRFRDWEAGSWVIVIAALLIALIPRCVVSIRDERQEQAARERRCPSCGFWWTARESAATHTRWPWERRTG